MFDLTHHHAWVWKNEIQEDSPTLQSKHFRFLAKYKVVRHDGHLLSTFKGSGNKYKVVPGR